MITHDIQRFSTHLAAIYSNLAKPVLDVILYNYQLSRNVGAEGLLGLTISVQLTASLCQWISLYIYLHSVLSSFSALPHTAFWSIYRPFRSTGWLVETHTFKTSRIFRRNCLAGRGTDGKDARRARIREPHQA